MKQRTAGSGAVIAALVAVLISAVGGGGTAIGSANAATTGNTAAVTATASWSTGGYHVGYGTTFPGPGQPYGGCGVPQSERGTTDVVALNAFDAPGDSTAYPLPLPPGLASKVGDFANGHNCGRWVEVTIGDYCRGVNDGDLHKPFCRGTLVADGYNGATLTMLVADSCTDPNAWCRNSKHHLDLYQGSLNRFVKNGHAVGDLSRHWNNRKISWTFVTAPHYTGDIRIGFTQNARGAYPAIAISHLRNGIHGVDYLANGTWHPARQNGPLGQAFVIGGTTSGGTHFVIRVQDAGGALVANGRTYHFNLPSSCDSGCKHTFTGVSYSN